jgi:hypothetical protein
MSIFGKMIFWLVLKLEISYYRVMIPWRILVSFRDFFKDYIYAWWNIWNSIINFFFFLPLKRYFKKNLCDTPPLVLLENSGHYINSMKIMSLSMRVIIKVKEDQPYNKSGHHVWKNHVIYSTKPKHSTEKHFTHIIQRLNSKLQTTLFVFIQPLSNLSSLSLLQNEPASSFIHPVHHAGWMIWV